MGDESTTLLVERIGSNWIDWLMIPTISVECDDPISFVQKHTDLLNLKAQEKIESLKTLQQFHEASVLLMGVALHLARGIGANPKVLADLWCDTTRNHGALGENE